MQEENLDNEKDFIEEKEAEIGKILDLKIAIYRATKFLKKWVLSLCLSLILFIVLYIAFASFLDIIITRSIWTSIYILIFVHLIVVLIYFVKYGFEEANYSEEEIERNCTSCGSKLYKYYCNNCFKFDPNLEQADIVNELWAFFINRGIHFSWDIEDNKLVRIGLEKRNLTTIPPIIGELKSLVCLDLSKNKLTEIPVSIGNLTSLKILYLYRNQLTTLPESIGDLTSLEDLVLYSNKLSSLPDSIINLKSLIILNIQDNLFTELPEVLKEFTSPEIISADEKVQDEWNSLRNIREEFHFRDHRKIVNILGSFILGTFFTICSIVILINTSNPFILITLGLGIYGIYLGIAGIRRRIEFMRRNRDRDKTFSDIIREKEPKGFD